MHLCLSLSSLQLRSTIKPAAAAVVLFERLAGDHEPHGGEGAGEAALCTAPAALLQHHLHLVSTLRHGSVGFDEQNVVRMSRQCYIA